MLLLALCLLGLGVASIKPADVGGPVSEVEWPSMRLCVADALRLTAAEKTTYEAIQTATDICYRHLHGQGLLNDFKIRRLKFTQQTYDERILLWMVVIITLSGVVLAGVQLIASFKLASVGGGATPDGTNESWVHTTEMSLEQGKLSVKSSITGLLILICSFAFFWVFVYEIFVIKPVDIDQVAGSQRPQANSGQISAGLIKSKADAAGQTASSSRPPASSAGR